MTERAELIELCKIAQHLGGPQNLSAVGIGRYLRLCSPELILNLTSEIERLSAALSAPNDITAEPAADYEGLRKQFLSLRALANSNSRMVSHWRNQCGIETRETMLANAANVSAERDTNQVLTQSLLDTEEQRDQLKAENEALRKDAERYRWLKTHGAKREICGTGSQSVGFGPCILMTLPNCGAPSSVVLSFDSADAVIDSAMSKEG